MPTPNRPPATDIPPCPACAEPTLVLLGEDGPPWLAYCRRCGWPVGQADT